MKDKDYNSTILNSIVTIKNSAFYENKYLTSIVLPENVKYVEDFAFRYCTIRVVAMCY